MLKNGYGIFGGRICCFNQTVLLKPVRQMSYNYLAVEKKLHIFLYVLRKSRNTVSSNKNQSP
jgi:hypothetical protein